MNIYEKCCRAKLRFKTTKGNLTVEDLLDLSLQSLDRVGSTIQEDIRNHQTSLLDSNKTDDTNDIKLKVIKYIIDEKQRRISVPIKMNDTTDEEVL
jgi:hypothetical protein